MDLKDIFRLPPKKHYYGDLVRALFLTAGFIMLITLPFFPNLIPVPIYVSIFAIIFINFFAGLTNPNQNLVIVANNLIALAATIIFEFVAINALFEKKHLAFYLVNQLLAMIFFVALYYSVKTLRGAFVKHSDD